MSRKHRDIELIDVIENEILSMGWWTDGEKDKLGDAFENLRVGVAFKNGISYTSHHKWRFSSSGMKYD